MTDVNLVKLNSLLQRCLKIVGGSRRLFKDCGVELSGLLSLERELRDSIGEVKERLLEEEMDRTQALLDGEGDEEPAFKI